MRKGQKSLEMVIGLIILLVVAAVVIKLFLGQMNPERISNLGPKQIELRLENNKITCRQLCSGFINSNYDKRSAIEFCKANFNMDLDEDGDKGEYFEYRAYDICEDRIYCFHIYDCNWESGSLDVSQCIKIMCEYYTELKGSSALAEEYIRDKVLPASNNVLKIKNVNYYSCYDEKWDYNTQVNADDPMIWVGYKQESWYNQLLQSNFCTPGSGGLQPPVGGTTTGCTKYCTDKSYKGATSSSCVTLLNCNSPNTPVTGYSSCTGTDVCCCTPKSGGGL